MILIDGPHDVYLVTNKMDGKRYIGCTSRGIKLRWKEHVYEAMTGSSYRFHRVIRKFGVASFKIQKLFSGSRKDALRWEYNYVKAHSDVCYNRSYVNSKRTRIKLSAIVRNLWRDPEYRTKVTQAHVGKVVSEETRMKRSKSQMGHRGYTTGMRFSVETRQKMSESGKKAWALRRASVACRRA